MNRVEMEDEVRHEVLDNPAIQVSDSDESGQHDDFNESGNDNEDDGSANEIKPDPDMRDNDDDDDNDDIPAYRLNISNHSADDKAYEPVATSENSLIDYLTEQINEQDLTENQRKIADYIIGNIDSNGYLTRSVSAISDDLIFQTDLNVSEDEISTVLQMIRDLDPAGVGAVDLRDCLLLQLERLSGSADNMAAYDIIDKYFVEFSKKHYDKIISAMKISAEDFRRALDIIRALNPKPGSLYGSADNAKSQHIIPDFSVEIDGDTITLTLLNNIPDLQMKVFKRCTTACRQKSLETETKKKQTASSKTNTNRHRHSLPCCANGKPRFSTRCGPLSTGKKIFSSPKTNRPCGQWC